MEKGSSCAAVVAASERRDEFLEETGSLERRPSILQLPRWVVHEARVCTSVRERSARMNGRLVDLLNAGQEFAIRNGRVKMAPLWPCWARVMEVVEDG